MERTNKAVKNYTIEFYRFLAGIFIAIYHFEGIYIGTSVYFQHFYIWVEFFFVISGFFLARNVITKNSGSDLLSSVNFTCGKFKKLFPPYIIAFLFSFFVTCIINGTHLKDVIPTLFKFKWEISMLQLSGFDNVVSINGPTGYISALLISTLILHYLLQNHLKAYANFLAPILIICIYSHIIQKYGNLSQWMAYESWFCVGIIRAIAGMSVGALAFIILNSNGKIQNLSHLALSLLKAVCILSCLSLVVYRNNISYADLLIFIPIFAILISITYATTELNANKKIRDAIFNYLGKISYPTYLIHYGICELLHHYMKINSYWKAFFIYIFIVIIAAIILRCCSDVLTKKMPQFVHRLHLTV